MRILIIGTGSIGKRHMRTLRMLCPGACFDVLRVRPSLAQETDSNERFTVSSNLVEAMNKKPQLMIVANCSALHLPGILAAIKENVPFYAEKPLVSSAEDLKVLCSCIAIHEKLPPNMVGCNLRFLPSLQVLKGMVNDGILGNIVHASFEAGQWLPDWRSGKDYRETYSAKRSLGGGVALDLIHEIDSARWILGDFSDVQAMCVKNSVLEIDVEDSASFLMRAHQGAVVMVHVNYVSRSPFRRYRIVGDQGTAEWDLPSRKLCLSTAAGATDVSLCPMAFDVSQTYVTAMTELLKAIEERGTTSQSIEEGIAALELIFRSKSSRSTVV